MLELRAEQMLELRAEQDQIKALLADSITLLCKDKLRFQNNFVVEALIGVTIDDKHACLWSINEAFSSDKGASTPRNCSSRANTADKYDAIHIKRESDNDRDAADDDDDGLMEEDSVLAELNESATLQDISFSDDPSYSEQSTRKARNTKRPVRRFVVVDKTDSLGQKSATSPSSAASPSKSSPRKRKKPAVDADEDRVPESKPVVVKEEDIMTYEIYEGASRQGRDLLVDNIGFSYTVKRVIGNKKTWTCSIRSNKTKCGASLVQVDDSITASKIQHTHPGDPQLRTNIRLKTKLLNSMRDDLSVPVSDVVNNVLKNEIDDFTKTLPSHDNLLRIAGHFRHKTLGLPKPEKKRLSRWIENEDVGELLVPEEMSSVVEIQNTEPNPDISWSSGCVKFEIVKGGSSRGRDKLIDDIGYSYNLKRTKGDKKQWWCSVRNKKVQCCAGLIQVGSRFKRISHHDHIHPPNLEHLKKVKNSAQLKQMVKNDDTMAIKDAVNTVVPIESADPDIEKSAKRQRQNLKVKAKRLRKKLRCEDPNYDMLSTVDIEEQPNPSIDASSTVDIEEQAIEPNPSINALAAVIAEDHQYQTFVTLPQTTNQELVQQYDLSDQKMLLVYME